MVSPSEIVSLSLLLYKLCIQSHSVISQICFFPTDANNNNNPSKVDIASLVGLTSNEANQRGYVFEGNPTVQPLKATSGNQDIGAKLELQLAVNTAQFGLTFEDR